MHFELVKISEKGIYQNLAQGNGTGQHLSNSTLKRVQKGLKTPLLPNFKSHKERKRD